MLSPYTILEPSAVAVVVAVLALFSRSFSFSVDLSPCVILQTLLQPSKFSSHFCIFRFFRHPIRLHAHTWTLLLSTRIFRKPNINRNWPYGSQSNCENTKTSKKKQDHTHSNICWFYSPLGGDAININWIYAS